MRSRRISANLCQEKRSQGGNKTNYLLLNEMLFLNVKTLGKRLEVPAWYKLSLHSSDMHESYVISGVFNSFKP